MRSKVYFISTLVVLLAVMVFSLEKMKSVYPLPYPHFSNLLVERDGVRDITGILFGFRGTAADMVWIDFIQYLGGGVLPDEDASRAYDLIKHFSQRIIRIDPFHHSAILYGAGMLAWFNNVDRPDEAIELLEEGSRNEPDYWPYKTYLAAIMFKKDLNNEKALRVLEEAVHRPDCPIMVKNMLANIYKKKKEYLNAMKVWEGVLMSDDSYYHEHAIKQIAVISNLMR